MTALIAIIFPSILGLKTIDYLKKGINKKETIYYITILILFSTLINEMICYLIFNIIENITILLNNYPLFFVKYTIMSIVINIILALTIIIIKNNISFKIEVEKNEKTKKTKKAKKTKNN